MASRSKLLGVSIYDRDGGLDWFVASDWVEWYEWRLKQGVSSDELKKEVTAKFEQALEFALKLGGAEK